MRTKIYVKRTLAVLICLIMMLSILPTSIFAAKEMFSPCSYIGIRGCAIPVPGEKPDFDVEENWPSQYTIMSVNWYKDSVSPANAVGGTETFKGNTVYIVEFEVWANDGYYFTNNNGNTTVEADVSPNYAEYGEFEAQVMNVYGQSASKYLTVRYTFPKTEGQNTAEQDPNVISAVNLTGLDLPVHHMPADTTVSSDNYRVSTEVVWKNQDGSAFSGVFEYGKSYTAMIYLFVGNSYDFAKDYSHPLASAEKPMPAVTVTLDGEPLSVLPDYTRNQFMRCLVATKTVKCEGKLAIDSVNIANVVAPTTGGVVSYNFDCLTSGYLRLESLNDATHHKGVAWRVDGGNYLETGRAAFEANETYQIVIRLAPKEGFEFAADNNGNTKMTAIVNGNAADIKSSKTEAIVTFTFPKTGNNVLTEVAVTDIDAPVTGQTPDYTATFGSTNYIPDNSVNASSKNGITWYNETDKKNVRPGEKFEAGKVYSVLIMVWAEDGCEFRYTSGSININGTVNGQVADVTARSNAEAILNYVFPKTEEHKCSPIKVAEHKATCTEDGRREHYFCSECGKFFEDSKCTKEITNISTWGVIPMLEHTGGKATCDNRAICKNCGQYYGELGEHNYGSAWDYKDATGHAHKCKICGATDTVQAHSASGTPKCGETAKCSECKMEFGAAAEHQWSKTFEYSDSKGHAYKCTVCGKHDTLQEHTGGTADCKNKAKCSACGEEYGKTGDHKWSDAWGYKDSKGHAHTCTVCGEHDALVEHAGGQADCQNKAKCSACGEEYGKTGDHKWSDKWDYSDKKGHAHACTVKGCTEHSELVQHTPGAEATESAPQICTVCNYVIEPAKEHKHKLTKVAAVDADCTTDGMEQHYVCDGCDMIFSDSKGTKEIKDKDSLIIPATGHKESKWKKDADMHWKECTAKGCDAVTVEKEAHDFNNAGKCTVCSYKKGAETEPDEPEDTTDGQDTTPPDETDDTAPVTPDTEDDNDPSPAPADNSLLWIVVIAAGVLVVACVTVTVIVVTKKSKKNG